MLVNWEGDWNPFLKPFTHYGGPQCLVGILWDTGISSMQLQAILKLLKCVLITTAMCFLHSVLRGLTWTFPLSLNMALLKALGFLSCHWEGISPPFHEVFLKLSRWFQAAVKLPCYPSITGFRLLSIDCRKASCYQCSGNWPVRSSLIYMVL